MRGKSIEHQEIGVTSFAIPVRSNLPRLERLGGRRPESFEHGKFRTIRSSWEPSLGWSLLSGVADFKEALDRA